MPRRARLCIEGFPLHIIQRGNNKSACFFSDADRILYLDLLREISMRHGCAVHAYVLMTNHVHLLLTPHEKVSASLLMKNLGQRFVQFINRKHVRTGSLWEGRFRSSVVDSATYLLTCQRYIESNPVRAAMVGGPADYPWSSYGTNALGEPSQLVVPHDGYLRLGNDDESRLVAYRRLFGVPLDQSELEKIRNAANGGFALGSKAFLERLERATGSRVSRGIPGRPRRKDDEAQTTLSRLEEKRGLSPVLV